MSDFCATPHIPKTLLTIVIFVCLLGWALVATWSSQYEASWQEGDAFVTFVYEYNLPFWRLICAGQASDFQGEFWAAQSFNITTGWWHLTVKGAVIINAWKAD